MYSKYTDNPQTFQNGFFSSSRNTYLLTTVGIGMYSFSNIFKKKNHNILVGVSLLIFLFTLLLSINTNYGYYKYIKILEKDKKKLPEYINLKIWNKYLYISIFYTIFIFIILVVLIIKNYSLLFSLL